MNKKKMLGRDGGFNPNNPRKKSDYNKNLA